MIISYERIKHMESMSRRLAGETVLQNVRATLPRVRYTEICDRKIIHLGRVKSHRNTLLRLLRCYLVVSIIFHNNKCGQGQRYYCLWKKIVTVERHYHRISCKLYE
jgi:hypothetical protein